MHSSHVPHSGPLARETKLQRVLACEGRNNKLQLPDELHPLDPRHAAPKSQQCHSSV